MNGSGAAPVDGPGRLGNGYLALLADQRKLTIMRVLRRGPATSALLSRHLGDLSERRVREHVRVLARDGIAVRLPGAWNSHRVAWGLSESGRELLDLYELIVRCERPLRPARADASCWPLARVLADVRMRAVIRALAGGRLTLAELQYQLPWIARNTLKRCLQRLLECGVLLAHGAHGARRYELRRRARGPLALVALRGMYWRLRFTPEHPPLDAGDLPGVVMLLAPIVRAPAGVHGICVMQALPDAVARVRWPDAHLSVLRGRIALLPAGSRHAPRARMRATSLVWCEAMLSGVSTGIEVEGDRTLADVALGALASPLRA